MGARARLCERSPLRDGTYDSMDEVPPRGTRQKLERRATHRDGSCIVRVMGKNIIVSEETIRDLLEAHASLSAWYYELWGALRAANATARTPDDAARAA